jgi:hypothetical protein
LDEKALRRLDEYARTLADKLGVRASIRLEEADAAALEPTGPRLVLTVSHDDAEARHRDLRLDQPHLMARIEQEIPLLAQELGQH